MLNTTYEQEVRQGKRFRFGRNWKRFLSVIDDERVEEAERSLKVMLGLEQLTGKTFLDVGCGSGLFSLAARRLGASVLSFDLDLESVACAQELRQKYFPDDKHWVIEAGSVLDTNYLRSLRRFDIVYCWGVLHHTGAMWEALENAAEPVAEGGRLFIALYNDQGVKSKIWSKVKRFYCCGLMGKTCVLTFFVPFLILRNLSIDLLKGRSPIARYSRHKKSRGMSPVHDCVDWLGGYPFEVANPDDVLAYYRSRGFALEKLVTCGGGSGNNQFVFVKR